MKETYLTAEQIAKALRISKEKVLIVAFCFLPLLNPFPVFS
jgi:hypothetical protein